MPPTRRGEERGPAAALGLSSKTIIQETRKAHSLSGLFAFQASNFERDLTQWCLKEIFLLLSQVC